MTDEQIIKAMECCSNVERITDCGCCPYYRNGCLDKVHLDAIDLINRQRAEISELQHKYDLAVAEREANVKGFTETLERQRAEIERKNRILESYALQYGTVADKDVLLKQVKAEAVKEFAARVKLAFYYEFEEIIPSIMADKIDNIAKEMVGERE